MKPLLENIARTIQDNWMVLLLVAALAAIWLLLGQQSTALESVEEFDSKVQAGRPMVVELFSNT